MKTRQLLVGTVVSLSLLLFLIKKVDFEQLFSHLGSVDLHYFVLAVLLIFVVHLQRTARWKYLLHHDKDIGLKTLFVPLMIGNSMNLIIPAKGGELTRAYVLGQKENLSKSYLLATIMLEKGLDLFTLLAFLAALSLIFPLPAWGRELAWLSSLVFVTMVSFLLLAVFKRERFLDATRALLGPFPIRIKTKVVGLTQTFMAGLTVLHCTRDYVIAAASSIVIWLTYGAMLFSLSQAMDIHLPPYGSLFLAAVLQLTAVVPSLPWYAGTYEAALVGGLTLFQEGYASALVLALLLRTAQLFPVGLGFLFAMRESFRLTTDLDHMSDVM